MNPYEWFILGPTLSLGILIPLARSARWRTLGLAVIVCGVLLAATTLTPWKTGWLTWSPEDGFSPFGARVWRSERWTEIGLSYSWHGSLVLALGLWLGMGAFGLGSRPRDELRFRMRESLPMGCALDGGARDPSFYSRAAVRVVVIGPPHHIQRAELPPCRKASETRHSLRAVSSGSVVRRGVP